MKIARIIAMLLLVATCLTMIVACDNGNEENKPAVTTKNPSSDNPVTPGATTTGRQDIVVPGNVHVHVDHNVPEANYDTTFKFLAWEQGVDEYYDFDELPADADDVQTELYNRNKRVEDYLGITLEYNPIAGGSGNVKDFVQTAETSINGNTHAYDAVAAYTRCGGVLSTRGVYVNLYNVEYIDTDMPWWPAEIISVNTIAKDRLYVASGDIATSLIYQLHFLIVNQEYAKELGVSIDELQQLALSGNGKKGGWTLDDLFKATEKGHREDDNKPGRTAGDRYGLYLCWHNKFDLFYIGAGLSYVTQTEDGLQLSSDYAGAKSRDIINRFVTAVTTNESYWIKSGTTSGDGFRLADGKSLMYAVEGSQLEGLRDAAFTYRILPAPKYNADQIEYYTSVGFPHSLYSIPTDANDKDMSGAVLEVMASESYNNVTPTLFGKVFLYKLTNDVTDTQVLQMIRDRATHDIGRTFFDDLGGDTDGPVRLWRKCLYDQENKVTQYRKEHKDRWDKILQEQIYDKIVALP